MYIVEYFRIKFLKYHDSNYTNYTYIDLCPHLLSKKKKPLMMKCIIAAIDRIAAFNNEKTQTV